MSTMHRQRVIRADGRAINVVQRRAHLSYCFSGCCCARAERGYAAVPADTFKEEWPSRKLRNVVHLTRAGCVSVALLSHAVTDLLALRRAQSTLPPDVDVIGTSLVRLQSEEQLELLLESELGGMIATVRSLTGQQPKAYFGDSSRPDRARVRDLRQEALRVYRSRVVNPKWLDSIRRHGYKGGLELAQTSSGHT